MKRREFIRGVAATAVTALTPVALVAPAFTDIDPDARYDERWHWFRLSAGKWVPVDDEEPRGTPSTGAQLSEYLLEMRRALDPDSAYREDLCRPLGLLKVGSTDWLYLEDTWLREFYRRHA